MPQKAISPLFTWKKIGRERARDTEMILPPGKKEICLDVFGEKET